MNDLIRNRQAVAQIIDFRKLHIGNITPTDIDGFIEYNDKYFIFIETKYRDKPLPTGQRLALQRLCDTLTSAGKHAIVFITSHYAEIGMDIDFGETIVTEYRCGFQWVVTTERTRLQDAILSFIDKQERGS